MSEVFAAPRATFEAIIDWLDSPDAASFEHGALEQHLDRQGRDLLLQLFQSHLDLRAVREQRRPVADAFYATRTVLGVDWVVRGPRVRSLHIEIEQTRP